MHEINVLPIELSWPIVLIKKVVLVIYKLKKSNANILAKLNSSSAIKKKKKWKEFVVAVVANKIL